MKNAVIHAFLLQISSHFFFLFSLVTRAFFQLCCFDLMLLTYRIFHRRIIYCFENILKNGSFFTFKSARRQTTGDLKRDHRFQQKRVFFALKTWYAEKISEKKIFQYLRSNSWNLSNNDCNENNPIDFLSICKKTSGFNKSKNVLILRMSLMNS